MSFAFLDLLCFSPEDVEMEQLPASRDIVPMNVLGTMLWPVQNKNDEPTAQVMSPKHKTLEVDMNTL